MAHSLLRMRLKEQQAGDVSRQGSWIPFASCGSPYYAINIVEEQTG